MVKKSRSSKDVTKKDVDESFESDRERFLDQFEKIGTNFFKNSRNVSISF